MVASCAVRDAFCKRMMLEGTPNLDFIKKWLVVYIEKGVVREFVLL
jgi:hypothetical protein